MVQRLYSAAAAAAAAAAACSADSKNPSFFKKTFPGSVPGNPSSKIGIFLEIVLFMNSYVATETVLAGTTVLEKNHS